MAFYKLRQSSSQHIARQPSKAEQFERHWREFDEFYIAIISEDPKLMKKAKKKGKNLLQSKEINYNLEQMRKIKLYFYVSGD